MRKFRRPVSVVPLRGGFGNQLFCWAYGQGLEARGHSVLYDKGQNFGRGFALEGLIPQSRMISIPPTLWRRFINPKGASSGGRVLQRIVEDQTAPPMIPLTDSRMLIFHWGYWQSLDYFVDIREELRFKLQEWLWPHGRQEQMPRCAIHVRRGDYVSDPGAAETLGVLPIQYYSSSVQAMKLRGFSEFVYVTDDQEWVAHNLLSLTTGMRVLNGNAMSDFKALAVSSGIVMSNSTFSWWASFLADGSGTHIIAPQTWFRNPTINSERLVPNGWYRI